MQSTPTKQAGARLDTSSTTPTKTQGAPRAPDAKRARRTREPELDTCSTTHTTPTETTQGAPRSPSSTTPRKTQRAPRTPGAKRARRARGPEIPDKPPGVAMRLCVGDSVVPASADNAVDPFARWVYRALVGPSYSRLADRTPGASLRNLPTAVKLHRLSEAQRGPRKRLVRFNCPNGPNPQASDGFVSVKVDGVDVELSMRKPLRMKATEKALSWLFGALRADLCSMLAAGPAATGRQPAADAADTLFTEEQIETMRAHHISMYCYGALGTRCLLAAPKTALLQCGNRLTKCPGKKRFRIRAVYDKSGKVRKPRGAQAQELISKALRLGAARALSAACAYHDHDEIDAVAPADESSAGSGAAGESASASDSAGSLPLEPPRGGDSDDGSG